MPYIKTNSIEYRGSIMTNDRKSTKLPGRTNDIKQKVKWNMPEFE